MPTPCPSLGAVLPAVLQRSTAEAAVQHLPSVDQQRLPQWRCAWYPKAPPRPVPAPAHHPTPAAGGGPRLTAFFPRISPFPPCLACMLPPMVPGRCLVLSRHRLRASNSFSQVCAAGLIRLWQKLGSRTGQGLKEGTKEGRRRTLYGQRKAGKRARGEEIGLTAISKRCILAGGRALSE